MNKGLHWGLLCLLVLVVLGLGERGVRADQHRFETDYILCPVHLRVPGPQELRAARGLKAGELRVSWTTPPSLAPVSGSPLDQAVITVIADDGASPVVEHRPPSTVSVLLDEVPRGRDLEVAVAVTRQGHVISDIRRIRLRSTQIRTWDRTRPQESTVRVQTQESTVRVQTQATDPPPPQLAPVTGLTPSAPDTNPHNSMRLSWTAPTDPTAPAINRFAFQYCSDAICSVPSSGGEQLDTQLTDFTVSSLVANTAYHFRIQAVADPNSGYSDSEWSDTVPATTDKIQLAKVTGLTASRTSTQLLLDWATPEDTENILNYRVELCLNDDCSSLFSHNTIEKGAREEYSIGEQVTTIYYFRVLARAVPNSDYRDSEWSDIIPTPSTVTTTNYTLLCPCCKLVAVGSGPGTGTRSPLGWYQ